MIGRVKIGTLVDHREETRGDVCEMRRRFSDVNLTGLVDEWLVGKRSQGLRPDTVNHPEYHIRWLLPAGSTLLRSQVTSEYLARRLAEYEGKRATRRKVGADWSSFFGWLHRPKALFAFNAMRDVDLPKSSRPPIRFYELDQVERIVAAQTGDLRSLFAFMYGTAVESRSRSH